VAKKVNKNQESGNKTKVSRKPEDSSQEKGKKRIEKRPKKIKYSCIRG